VTITVELGRVRVPLEQVTRWTPGSVVELARTSDQPVDVLVNGTPVARAEVVTVGDHYGIRVVELVSPEDRLKRFAR
ncbi:MAG TPA: FliM/FliN family flagellar motor switch protein, partial [Planctomycetota bacterium]|nr:FliM/FliN family flagellar motor switch protein [Planctomycetota bacterium]